MKNEIYDFIDKKGGWSKQLNLPICNKNTLKKYKKPRWLLVVFWTSEQFQRIKK